MKKSVLAISALSLALLAGNASARTNDVTDANNVRFLGAVSAMTCNLVPWVNGSVNNVVNVGVAASKDKGPVVNFALKANPTDTNCSGLAGNATANPAINAASSVSIAFMGPLDTKGLANQSGSASDAWVEIIATNADNNKNTTAITQGDVIRDIAIANIWDITAGAPVATGATFTAQLNGGTQIGDYQSAIAYQVSYN